jgi:hypothetical protein
MKTGPSHVVVEFVAGDESFPVELSVEEAQAFAAFISLESARAGDMSQITERLDKLSDRERQFLADYLRGKVKTRKRRGLTAIQKSLVHHFIVLSGPKRESAVEEVCARFGVKRRYVFKLLKDKERLARIKKADCTQ